VTADVIHTLLQLSRPDGGKADGGGIVAAISATAVDGMENLPAKLILLGTSYSTLSEESLPGYHVYLGTFSFRNIPPGTYRMAIERVGSETLYPPPLILKAGETVRPNWKLLPSQIVGNLAPNPDLSLRWVAADAPDHWRFDRSRQQRTSDNITVVPGQNYRAGCELKQNGAPGVELQWMSHAWEAMKSDPVPLHFSPQGSAGVVISAPAGALFVRFAVKSQQDPSTALRSYFVTPQHP